MKHNIQPLTDLEIKTVNGGNGIVAYDPVTGLPFPEETGGYGNGEMDTATPLNEPG